MRALVPLALVALAACGDGLLGPAGETLRGPAESTPVQTAEGEPETEALVVYGGVPNLGPSPANLRVGVLWQGDVGIKVESAELTEPPPTIFKLVISRAPGADELQATGDGQLIALGRIVAYSDSDGDGNLTHSGGASAAMDPWYAESGFRVLLYVKDALPAGKASPGASPTVVTDGQDGYLLARQRCDDPEVVADSTPLELVAPGSATCGPIADATPLRP